MVLSRRSNRGMTSVRLEGLVLVLRVGRWGRGYRALVTLTLGASLCLLVLAFTPHPDATFHRSFLHGVRRIHQETDDYTGPKPPGQAPQEDSQFPISGLAGQEDVELLQQNSPQLAASSSSSGSYSLPLLAQPQASPASDSQEDTGMGQVEVVMLPLHNAQTSVGNTPSISQGGSKVSVNSQDPIMVYSQLAMDIPRNRKEGEHIMKAQETALTALQHGYKLSANQKTLIARMDPKEKKAVEERVTKMRGIQERAYLEHLRMKKQILPLKGGGEKIMSTPRLQVRFPVALKMLSPEKWAPQQMIFQNLTHYPWAKSVECANYSTIFWPPRSLPTRALASFPSSGNTWVRYLVEGATGIFTGSLYDDSSLTRKGMYGEGVIYDSGMTILQKSHGYTTGDAMKASHRERLKRNHMDELNYQGVLVIRNPFKALISHRHLDVGGHTGYAPKAHFLGKGWAEFVMLKIGLWKDFYVDWLSLCQPVNIHVTYYEHLKENPVEEMEKIMHYLKLPIDNNRLYCVGSNTDGLFKRKPSKNVPLDFNPFTRELKDIVYKAIAEVDSVLKKTGKDGLPLSKYELYDPWEAKVVRQSL
ncbi:uncharacterized protein [Procambarus clarkii]|uniref:uncharacterized protein n=1 Tax=Procambarus clarkii TaxID=6728 RepID=UPI003744A013